MKTAKFIKTLDWLSDARLYKLSEPVGYSEWDDDLDQDVEKKTDFVVASAAMVRNQGPETYLFPCDSEGEPYSWLELNGSFKGGLCHKTALNNAGYEVRP